MELPAAQVALLEAASATEPRRIDDLAADTGEDQATLTGAAAELESAGLVTVTETAVAEVEPTEEGRAYADDTLPEVQLYRAAVDAGADAEPAPMGRVIGASGLDGDAVDIALALQPRQSSSVNPTRCRPPSHSSPYQPTFCSYLDYTDTKASTGRSLLAPLGDLRRTHRHRTTN